MFKGARRLIKGPALFKWCQGKPLIFYKIFCSVCDYQKMLNLRATRQNTTKKNQHFLNIKFKLIF